MNLPVVNCRHASPIQDGLNTCALGLFGGKVSSVTCAASCAKRSPHGWLAWFIHRLRNGSWWRESVVTVNGPPCGCNAAHNGNPTQTSIVTRWALCEWYGTPKVIQFAVPRASLIEGCGCLARLKDWLGEVGLISGVQKWQV